VSALAFSSTHAPSPASRHKYRLPTSPGSRLATAGEVRNHTPKKFLDRRSDWWNS
jgi:hypothetical protein